MDKNEFERLLVDTALPPPSDDITEKISPWKKSLNLIIFGLIFSTFRIHSFGLDLILPVIGTLLLLLGFRMVRKDNKYFALGYVFAIIDGILEAVSIFISSTIYNSAVESFLSERVYLGLLISVPSLLVVFFLWQGIRFIQNKAKAKYKRRFAAPFVFLWYCAILLIGIVLPEADILTFVIVTLFYALGIFLLFRMSKEIDDVGYCLKTASIKISDLAVSVICLSVVSAELFIGYTFFAQHKTQWTPLVEATQTQVVSIKKELKELGVPENIINDMTDEDVLACADVEKVVIEHKDIPVNKGRKVVTKNSPNITHIHYEYDIKELRLTNIALKIKGENTAWRIIRHFHWVVDPGVFRTEGIDIFSGNIKSFKRTSTVSGRLLCTKDGTEYTSGFAFYQDSLSENVSTNDKYEGPDFSAGFSFPDNSGNQRGYITYTITKKSELDGTTTLVDEWLNYVHQKSFLQYPVQTAYDYNNSFSIFSDNNAFVRIQNSLQFYSE